MDIFDKCRRRVSGDAISDVAVDSVGLDFRPKFGDSRSKRSLDIRTAPFVMDDEAKTSFRSFGVLPKNETKRTIVVHVAIMASINRRYGK